MFVHKLALPPEFLPDLVGCEETVWDYLGVEFHLGTGDGVYEGGYDFEEGVYEEGEVDYYGFAEVFWVVGLEDVEDLGERCVRG